jgi:glutaredoxin
MADYVVFGRGTCKYCQKACDLLRKRGLSYEFRPFQEDGNTPKDQVAENKRLYQSQYAGAVDPDFITVPRIFYNSVFVGGFAELSAHLGDARGPVPDTLAGKVF